ncbi:MAG: hypothetical protein ACREFJ_08595 [Acetobacteraceae bacterium]
MQHDPRLQRLLDVLPRPARHSYAWLIRPQAKWVRLPLGFALIAGGTLGFLPVLGFWMLPIGALLIGEDIPPVRRATLRVLGGLQRGWDAWRSPSRRTPRPGAKRLAAPSANR